jgi:hypothetical protein
MGTISVVIRKNKVMVAYSEPPVKDERCLIQPGDLVVASYDRARFEGKRGQMWAQDIFYLLHMSPERLLDSLQHYMVA